jgi:N6-L-threonylcarbamoyladenine synthase
MKVLGIETSCDECSAAIVEDGKYIISNVIATQIPYHAAFNGVVPEIASRMHTEWIDGVVKEAFLQANLKIDDVDAVAVTNRPGLLGALLVGLSFAKAFAWAKNIPYIAVDHMLAHLYASRLFNKNAKLQKYFSENIVSDYPFIGLLVSGGHSIICRADDFDKITVLGATIDDAIGEAFDKVSKHYGFGYPGGAVIDKLAKNGDKSAFNFPLPSLHKGNHRYDFSYSGLKNAVINQKETFQVKKDNILPEDIAASFQKTAIDILTRSLMRAVEDTGLKTVVIGGGVSANSYLREKLALIKGINCIFPPMELCGDNGAMIAGIGYQYLVRGQYSPLNESAFARVQGFKR